MKERTKFYMDCHLAGRKYHEADFVWEKLKVGTLLRLERDDENKYDTEAVAVMYELHAKCFGILVILGLQEKSIARNNSLRCFFVVPPGIEPGTHGFSVRCSTN